MREKAVREVKFDQLHVVPDGLRSESDQTIVFPLSGPDGVAVFGQEVQELDGSRDLQPAPDNTVDGTQVS